MTKLTVKILIGVLLSYVFLVSSCYKKKGIISSFSSSLSEAELLILTYPDSALSLLENLNPNNEDISLKARYALLLTQAEDKNYILHTDDSLINIAVSYYDSVRNVEQAVKAHYYLGRVWQDMQNEAAAVNEYFIALHWAEQSGKNEMLCLLYGNLGQIYFQQDLLAKADSLFMLSESIAIQKNDSFNLCMGLVARGNIYLRKKEYSNSMESFERALAIARNVHNANALEIVFNSMAAFYASIDYPEKTIEYTQKGLLYKTDSLDSARLYLLEGTALVQLASYDSAKISVSKSLSTNNLSTKAAAYLLLADIEKRQGDLNEALSFHDMYIECLDSMDVMETRTRSAISKGDRLLHIERYQRLFRF